MQAVLLSSHLDETNILNVLLQQAGFIVRIVKSLEEAVESWPDNPADFILVALEGDHTKKITLLKQLRAHTVVPILLISDPLTEDLQVNYIDAGADLLMIRPYSVRVLMVYIRALVRRSPGLPFFSLPVLTQKDLNLDPSNRTVQVGDREPVRLTHLEFRLLFALMTHIGQIIPTDMIVELVWGYPGEGNRELVRGLVQRVRAKVEIDSRQPDYILTEPGIGYFFKR